MISMDVNTSETVVEVTPTSPPPDFVKQHNNNHSRMEEDEEDEEIRVTDSPEPTTRVSLPSTSSDGSSGPDSPRNHRVSTSPLASPPTGSTPGRPGPLIFQPFLPLPAGIQNQMNHHHHRALPFSIDNILKPTFGGNRRLLPLAAAAAAAQSAAASAALQAASVASTYPNFLASMTSPTSAASSDLLRRRSPSATSSTGSLIKSELKTPPSSPLNNNNQPVDLSSKPATSPTASGDLNKSDDGSKKDDDVPPGMVRGPNGQLWPAWVFCTRYSDRPSSGKNCL